jgi:hypothetical protein
LGPEFAPDRFKLEDIAGRLATVVTTSEAHVFLGYTLTRHVQSDEKASQ